MADFRSEIRGALIDLIEADEARLSDAAETILAEDAVFHVSAPIEALHGRDAILQGFIRPLRAAFPQARRRDLLFIGGDNIREPGGRWVSSVTHYVGNHEGSFARVAPSDHLAFLRSGEFYRVEDGRIVEARIILDLPDLMRQAGRSPFPAMLGTEIAFPAPATQDGLCPTGAGGEDSLAVMQRMMTELHTYDPGSFGSPGQVGEGGVWADDMMWYGPCGIGSNTRWAGFIKDHRASFLTAFPDRKGGNHYCRFGDANYACASGWPSMTMTHAGDYLGVAATGRALTLRVMDFYRVEGGRLAENWVHLDYVDLFAQMGVDLLAR